MPSLPPRRMFQPRQIVYLACDHGRLYTEVIEVLVDRQLAWVRPLVLVTPEETLPLANASVLGGGGDDIWPDPAVTPDLIWPLNQFHPALDTDFMELLSILPRQTTKAPTLSHSTVLSQFTRRLWEAR